jgi:alkylhydroperoxidase/carboxymuconolactone decarboxylase family protein YurZ
MLEYPGNTRGIPRRALGVRRRALSTRDFQEFVTRYAWGGVWTRPGLDRRQRSLVTLTALVEE